MVHMSIVAQTPARVEARWVVARAPHLSSSSSVVLNVMSSQVSAEIRSAERTWICTSDQRPTDGRQRRMLVFIPLIARTHRARESSVRTSAVRLSGPLVVEHGPPLYVCPSVVDDGQTSRLIIPYSSRRWDEHHHFCYRVEGRLRRPGIDDHFILRKVVRYKT
jgi:hypothetical protein